MNRRRLTLWSMCVVISGVLLWMMNTQIGRMPTDQERELIEISIDRAYREITFVQALLPHTDELSKAPEGATTSNAALALHTTACLNHLSDLFEQNRIRIHERREAAA